MTATKPSFVDAALSKRLEAAEVAMHRALVQTLVAAHPDSGGEVLSIGGGCAAYLGGNVSPSRALGLGMEGEVALADVVALEDFYRARGMPVRILVSPFADPSLFGHLGARGFQLVELDTMLVRAVSADDSFPALPSGVTIDEASPEQANDWVEASLEGMLEAPEPPPKSIVRLFAATFHTASCKYYFASLGTAVAGTGALDMQAGAAYFFATSTLPPARKRGVQSALIGARLAYARDLGCDLCFSRTEAGNGSQRNLERWGFRPVYSRASLVKQFD